MFLGQGTVKFFLVSFSEWEGQNRPASAMHIRPLLGPHAPHHCSSSTPAPIKKNLAPENILQVRLQESAPQRVNRNRNDKATRPGYRTNSPQRHIGGVPNPNEWGIISESVCDLSNAILNDPDWDPDTLHSPLQHKVPPDKFLPNEIPIAPTLSLTVSPTIPTHGMTDVYIDDTVTVAVDLGQDTRNRARAATLPAIHVVERPVHPTL